MNILELEQGGVHAADLVLLLGHDARLEKATLLARPVEVELLHERIERVAVVEEPLVGVAELVPARERPHRRVRGFEHLEPDDLGRLP